ncbi:hypothetical protein [Consotaella salsifontis]|uniref:STAS domain-containing protein n=1 Tax=Consotaella salsifontis TaxID=1365950 RepID=A0A1T4SUD5_9HYPH|nr:hypothetical protein [Consotaella salsifontis]SKA31508.1 hypothetical protein SAMN05428963_11416 [Consotaella salsifontis]
MTIVYDDHTVRCSGVCPIEEAPQLLEWLQNAADPLVDLSDCTYLHTAIVQILHESDARLVAAPTDPFLSRWIVPLIRPANAQAKESQR